MCVCVCVCLLSFTNVRKLCDTFVVDLPTINSSIFLFMHTLHAIKSFMDVQVARQDIEKHHCQLYF